MQLDLLLLAAAIGKIPMPLGLYKGWDSFPASFFGADIHGVESNAEMELVGKHQVVRVCLMVHC